MLTHLVLVVVMATAPKPAGIVRSINLPQPAAVQPVKGVVRPALTVAQSKPQVFGKVRAAITK